MIRIALIGTGVIACRRHIPAIDADSGFTLAGMADPAGRFPDRDVPRFDNHMAMLAALPDLDAVAICTPPAIRPAIAHDALAAGLHVLLEKPPAVTTDALDALARAADRARRTLFTAWHSQHNQAVAAARAALATETVETLSVTWQENVDDYHAGQDWIWRPGGFGVLDAGINALSILTRILPRPLVLLDADRIVPDGAATPIAATLRFDIPGDVVFDWRPGRAELRRIVLTTGSGRVLELGDSGGMLLIDGHVAADGPRAEYPDIYKRFAELIRAGRSEVDVAPLRIAQQASGSFL